VPDSGPFMTTGATRLLASTFGVHAGLGGIRHGIGDILQGNVAPGGIVIESWTEGPIATNMGGEPGMSVVPNLLVTGLLALVASSAVVVWAALFVQRHNGGWILSYILSRCCWWGEVSDLHLLAFSPVLQGRTSMHHQARGSHTFLSALGLSSPGYGPGCSVWPRSTVCFCLSARPSLFMSSG
jgi:hypothetical protein